MRLKVLIAVFVLAYSIFHLILNGENLEALTQFLFNAHSKRPGDFSVSACMSKEYLCEYGSLAYKRLKTSIKMPASSGFSAPGRSL